jgi:tetratricopeptide (TPR) repeat protein
MLTERAILLGCLLVLSAAAQPSTFDRAVQLHQAGRLDEAEKLYRALLAQGKSSAELCANLGALLAQKNDFPAAIRLYRQALRLDPKLDPLYLNLGLAHFKSGNFDEALASFEKFLASKPTHRQARELRASSLLQLERLAEAEAAYRELLTNNEPSIILGLAASLLQQQKTVEARALLEPAMSHAPSPELRLVMGQALLNEGQFQEAKAVFEELRASHPHLPLLRLNLGSVYWRERRTAEALALWEEEWRAHPNSFESNYTFGAALALSETRQAESEKLLRTALQLRPASARANYQLAKLLWTQGKSSGVVSLLQRATQTEPNYREAFYLLGMVQQKLGQRAASEAAFRRVKEISTQAIQRQEDLFSESTPR